MKTPAFLYMTSSRHLKANPISACYILHSGSLLGLFLESEDGGHSSSWTSIDFQRTARRCISEDSTLGKRGESCNEKCRVRQINFRRNCSGITCYFVQLFAVLAAWTIAQAVSRWFLTTAARIRARVWPNKICGGQSGAGAGLLTVLRFPLPIFIQQNSPSSQSPGAKWPTCRVDPIWTPPLPLCDFKKLKYYI
jgi:hypothetical protein